MNHRLLRCARHFLGVILVAATVSALSSTAQAFTSEGHFWGGVGAANLNHASPSSFGWWGPSLETGVVLDIGDFWRLTADLSGSHHFERDDEDNGVIGPHTVASGAVGVRYSFDIAIYVPYLGVAVAVHPLGAPSSANPNGELLSARATLGVDYRKSRRVSFGGAVNLYAPMTQPSDFPHYSSIRLQVGYHFRRF